MNFNRNQAKELSNAKELELFDNARPPKLNKFTVAELKRLVQRSRTLRDKLKDVKRTQVRSAQSKTGQRGTGAADRSADKAKLFSEVHDVFVARLEKVEAAAAKTKTAAPKASTKSTKKDGNLKTRADRTGVRQDLKKVKKAANAPKPTAAGKAKQAPAKKANDTKKGSSIKALASAAVANAIGEPQIEQAVKAGRSAKATTASKAAKNPELDAIKTKQAAARKPTPRGKVIETRIAKGGAPQRNSHASSLNKRKQGKRDNKG